MAELDNPYQPPTSHVADVPAAADAEGIYIEAGRPVEAGRGWTWIRDGFGYFRRQAGIWIILTVIFLAIVFGLQLVPIVGQIALPLVMPILVAGFMVGCQAIERGGEIELAHLFVGFRRNAGQLALVGAIAIGLSVVAVLPLMIVGGIGGYMAATHGPTASVLALGAGSILAFLVTLALIIPVNMALWFAPALVILEDQSAPRAIAESFRGTLKNIIPFLIFGVIVFVLGFFATIPLALGWLVLVPVMIASVYVAYRDIYFER